jgi:coenzyme PQQ precursor peptide PqqA
MHDEKWRSFRGDMINGTGQLRLLLIFVDRSCRSCLSNITKLKKFRSQKSFLFSNGSANVVPNPMKTTKSKKQWIKPQVKDVRISMESTAYSSEVYR